MQINLDPGFKKAYKNRIATNKKLSKQTETRIALFQTDHKNPLLHDHQLTGAKKELLKDYLSFARQNKFKVWDKEKARREIREIGEIWEIINKSPTLPSSPNFPSLPKDQNRAVNLLITLINQANYLIDKLIESLKEKHTREGGFSEKLLKRRLEYRNKS